MGRPSSIKKMPPDILEKFHALLRDPRVTQLDATHEINKILVENDEPTITKSATNRYKLSMAEAGAAVIESREMAELWIGKLGAAPQTKVANITSEIIRTSMLDLSLALKRILKGEVSEEVLASAIRMTKDLAYAQEKLEKAVSETTKRDMQLKAQAKREAMEEAAQNIEETARAQGMDEDQVMFWREKVLGG